MKQPSDLSIRRTITALYDAVGICADWKMEALGAFQWLYVPGYVCLKQNYEAPLAGLHDLGHYLVATQAQRRLPDFGFRDPDSRFARRFEDAPAPKLRGKAARRVEVDATRMTNHIVRNVFGLGIAERYAARYGDEKWDSENVVRRFRRKGWLDKKGVVVELAAALAETNAKVGVFG